MNKPFEVREYDSIIGNSEYRDVNDYVLLEPRQDFENLIRFVREFTSDKSNRDALEFMRIGYKRGVGDIISLGNYVGLIQMKNGFQIQVLPKIDLGQADKSNVITQKVFLDMLRSLKEFPAKSFNEASLNIERLNLYELFIRMYLHEVIRLVKRGMCSDYICYEENLSCFKGKLNVNQQIKSNTVHKERFYVSYDLFQNNCSENRIIKSTLEKLQKLTLDGENMRTIKQVSVHFDNVEVSTNYNKDFSSITQRRNNSSYNTLIQWSKVFLQNKSFSTFSGTTNSRALLFPMESVFESFVAKKMKNIFGTEGWNVSSQDKGKYLFVEPKQQFALRPDIVISKGERTVILDTKWKRLINNEGKNYGISQTDMYQMYAYSKKYKTSEVWLLYPITDEMRNHEPIAFYSGDETWVKVFFVDVANIEESLKKLKDTIEMV